MRGGWARAFAAGPPGAVFNGRGPAERLARRGPCFPPAKWLASVLRAVASALVPHLVSLANLMVTH